MSMPANKKDEWMKENSRRFVVKVMTRTEQDILQKLESVENKGGYIKRLIREDIAKSK